MAKRFAEHDGLDLTKTNEEVLATWMKNDIFHKSIDEREGLPQVHLFRRTLLPPMAILAFTMCWHAPSKTLSTATRPCRASK